MVICEIKTFLVYPMIILVIFSASGIIYSLIILVVGGLLSHLGNMINKKRGRTIALVLLVNGIILLVITTYLWDKHCHAILSGD